MEVGIRVVRGPDWKWQQQDGGEGHVGTLVEVGRPGNSNTPDKTVVVQWDSGFRTNYRVGYQGAYDLRVLDNAPIGIKHQNIICDACKTTEISGLRWKCAKCHDFDLCNACYMNNKHDLSHPFLRYEGPNCISIPVPKRQGSSYIEACGVFSGARVVRGPDWDWGNQDGGEGKTGIVLDVRGWDQESGRSVANVTWAVGATNVYRMGHKGKVDLKYKEAASGGNFYPEHLPVLGQQAEVQRTEGGSNCQFKVGDKVRVDLDVDILRYMQEGHGGWNPRMAEFIGRIGTVHRITERGDVRVQYEGCTNRWTFHAGALTKSKQFDVSDYVQISGSMRDVREKQKGHGEWTDNMSAALGKTGRVLKVYTDGDLRVQVGGQTWTFNPAVCTLKPYGKQTDNNTLGGGGGTAGVAAPDDGGSAEGGGTGTVEDSRHQNSSLSVILAELLQTSPALSTEPEKLVREAAQGHTDTVRDIIAKHTDKVDLKSSGKTALQVSAHQGHVDIVRLLLAAGANLELQDEDGDTALHYSAFGNQPEILELLLRKGAHLNAVNSGACSALHVAVNKQHLNCVKVLLKYKCDVNIQRSFMTKDHWSDADNSMDAYGDTALHDAIGKNSMDIVSLLTAYRGTDFTLRNKRGFNVLHHAALKGNIEGTRFILGKTRQIVDSKKDDGFAALHLACLNGHREVAEMLIVLGQADLEIRNNREQTPLLLAVSQGHTPIIQLLLEKGACVNVEDEDGDTCLHLALMRNAAAPGETSSSSSRPPKTSRSNSGPMDVDNMIGIARLLIEAGASIHKRNRQHKTPLELAADTATAEMLRACVDSRHSSGDAAGDVEECMVCSDTHATVTFHPCGHKVACEDCCGKMKKCLVCKNLIDKKVGPNGVISAGYNNGAAGGGDIMNLDELQAKVQEMEDCITCSICMERKKTVAFLCGHSACEVCSQALKICHMCRKPISKKINLFT